MSDQAAKQQVASEFPSDCGACGGGGGNGIRVAGRQLLVDGSPFHIKGVCWNPIPKGATHPAGLDFRGFADRDGDLMVAAGMNVVRTYEPILDRAVLDILWNKGLRVAMNVYPWGGASSDYAVANVAAVKDHPAVLLWEVGNEWNYNGFYVGLSFEASRARVAEVVNLIKQEDTTHPVVTVYGEIPSAETLNVLSKVDMWGINAYRGIGLYDLFDVWGARSDKPMYMAEYGADAFNANINAADFAAQAEATTNITREIIANSAVRGGVCSGGTIFEFADEWWKDGSGSPSVHDVGGVAPGGGPHPDGTFNEEWWGLVDIDRNPRPAYQAYKALGL